jgi:hypothetical protein
MLFQNKYSVILSWKSAAYQTVKPTLQNSILQCYFIIICQWCWFLKIENPETLSKSVDLRSIKRFSYCLCILSLANSFHNLPKYNNYLTTQAALAKIYLKSL